MKHLSPSKRSWFKSDVIKVEQYTLKTNTNLKLTKGEGELLLT